MSENTAVLHRIPAPGEKVSGLTRNQVYEFLRSGLLTGVRHGTTTFITDASLRALPEKLPSYSANSSTSAIKLLANRRVIATLKNAGLKEGSPAWITAKLDILKLGDNSNAWRAEDIRALIEKHTAAVPA